LKASPIIKKLLSTMSERILILDGPMGTMLQKLALNESDFRGERFKDHTCSLKGNNDLLSITCPQEVINIHLNYLEAGADIIKTNTFNANAISQSDYQLSELSYEMNRISASILRQTIDTFVSHHPDESKFAAGVIGPTNRTLSISPDVDDPAFRNITFEQLQKAYYDSARGLIDGGVDILLIETIFDTLNAKAAIYAIQQIFAERHISIPLMISGTITDKSGRTLSGQTPAAFYYSIEHASPLSVGFNCSLGAAQLKPFLKELSDTAICAISVHPNAGLPNAYGGYDETAQSMASHIREFADEQMINIAGGCCGSTPEHIHAICEALQGIAPRKTPSARRFTALSGLQPLIIDSNSLFVNIGERTNVAGSARFKKLIAAENYEQAVDVAREQVNGGAQIIDINMDDSMIEGLKAMTSFLRLIGSEPEISTVPVMVDSSKWEIIEAALRSIQGKAIVNSISLKEGEGPFIEKAMKIKRYGAAIVVMAFDEQGQAESFQRKIDICSRAYKLLTEKAGISPHDIILDPNIFAVGTGIDEHKNYAVDFFKAVSWIRENLPGALVSGGVSNVSFSFRGNSTVREAVNSAFLFHAIRAGMNMGIVNPTQLTVYEEIPLELRERVEDVLLNRREDATDRLIELVSSTPEEKQNDTTSIPSWRDLPLQQRLSHALVKGITKYIETDLKEALAVVDDPLKIIEIHLMNGMKIVGELFGSGKMFLPQVVKSARVMRKAVAFLTPLIEARKGNERSNLKKPRILLATVKGDVHDIGKNIVSVVLQCNNFDVIDMGVMVPCQEILDRAKKEKVDIIGLSGLITPSLEEMSYVASQMEKQQFTVPLLIGGATTSKMHTAVKIAPQYSGPVIHVRDASLAVQDCRNLFSEGQKDSFIKEVRSEYESLREKHDRTARQQELLTIDLSRKRRLRIDTDTYLPVRPAQTGITVFDNYSISELSSYIDWTFFFRAWEMKGQYPSVLDDSEEGRQAARLFDDAQAMLSTIINQNLLHTSGVIGLFPANSTDTDDIEIYSDESRSSVLSVIHCLRQQTIKDENKPNISLCDFLAPKSSITDYIGLFAVSAGGGVEELAASYERNNDSYSALMVKILADRLSEAFAERLHELVRKKYWGYAKDENLEIRDLLRVRYRGIRPAPGYPACPDHSEKRQIFELLKVKERAGISLTESYMMQPAASVCGYYFAHPESRYFALGKIGEDQIKDYAKRKGVTEEEVRRWVAVQL